MSALTAGPWSFHTCMSEPNHATACPNFTSYSIYIGSGETIIAEVSAYVFREGFEDKGWPRTPTPEENLAIANLMTAAPEMLAALEDAEIVLRRAGCKYTADIAQAAIAKARGEA